MLSLTLAVSVFVAAWAVTGLYLRYALKMRLLDIPNERSSHTFATPRGGGVGFIVTSLSGFVGLGCFGWMNWSAVVALTTSGVLVALVGYFDDRQPIPPRWRLLVHFAAAACVLGWLRGMPDISLGGIVLFVGWSGYVMGAFFLVWVLNLTNFMDGIDGLAAVEAISVFAGGVVLYWTTVAGTDHWIGPLVLVFAIMGFLWWNWPPAKIFMGDVGSGFLGLMMGALSLEAGWTIPALFWSWLILLGVFVVDATVTLLRRVAHAENIFQPHRSHAYQHLARRLGQHQAVTIIVAAINWFWLFPIAFCVAKGWLGGLTGVSIAYSPLVAVVIWLKAGRPDTSYTEHNLLRHND